MKYYILAPALILMSACASGHETYQLAESSGDRGATVLPIEDNRLRISYRAKDSETSRKFALLTAAEETMARGATWFWVTNAYSEAPEPYQQSGGTSVSIGGSAGSGGHSSVGVGIGIGIPIGGRQSSGDSVHALEIITGSGEQPDKPEVYNAADVRDALLGAPAG